MDAIQWSRQPVEGGINAHIQRNAVYTKACEDVIESLGDAAADIARGGGDDLQQVEPLQDAVVQLLEARRAAQLQAAALQELKGSYRAGLDVTDFKAAIGGRAQALAAAQPYEPQRDELFREFQMVAGGQVAQEDAGAANERIDDDIEIEGGAAQLAPNARCPITNKLLLDIEDPVQDALEYVYEKDAVVAFLRRLNPQRAMIVAGSTHQVCIAELVPAEKVLKEKRLQARLQRRGGGRGATQGGGGDEDVLDV